MELQTQSLKKRRSSGILKKSPHRKSLASLDFNAEATELEDENRRGVKRRVSFANTNQVKEICRVNDIAEKWGDSSSSIDTSNLDIQKLAISRKSKNEIGKDSIDALMSAPILQNDVFTASDVALLDGTSGCSEMHATDSTSILNTPNATFSHTKVERDACLDDKSDASKTIRCENNHEDHDSSHLDIDDIPVVMPSFLLKHMSNNANIMSDCSVSEQKQAMQATFNQSVVASYDNNQNERNGIYTSTPRVRHFEMCDGSVAVPQSCTELEVNYNKENMEQTGCIRAYLKPSGHQNKYFPVITSTSPEKKAMHDNEDPVLSLHTVEEDVEMEHTACIKHYFQNDITQTKPSVYENLISNKNGNCEAKVSVAAALELALPPNQTKLFDNDDVDMTECGFLVDVSTSLKEANKENLKLNNPSSDLLHHTALNNISKNLNVSESTSNKLLVDSGNTHVNDDIEVPQCIPNVSKWHKKLSNLMLSHESDAFSTNAANSKSNTLTSTILQHALNKPIYSQANIGDITITCNDEVDITLCHHAINVGVNDEIKAAQQDLIPTINSDLNTTTSSRSTQAIAGISTNCLPSSISGYVGDSGNSQVNDDTEVPQCFPNVSKQHKKLSNLMLSHKSDAFSTNAANLKRNTSTATGTQHALNKPIYSQADIGDTTVTCNDEVDITLCHQASNVGVNDEIKAAQQDLIQETINSGLNTTTSNRSIQAMTEISTDCLPASTTSGYEQKSQDNNETDITFCLKASGKLDSSKSDRFVQCLSQNVSLSNVRVDLLAGCDAAQGNESPIKQFINIKEKNTLHDKLSSYINKDSNAQKNNFSLSASKPECSIVKLDTVEDVSQAKSNVPHMSRSLSVPPVSKVDSTNLKSAQSFIVNSQNKPTFSSSSAFCDLDKIKAFNKHGHEVKFEENDIATTSESYPEIPTISIQKKNDSLDNQTSISATHSFRAYTDRTAHQSILFSQAYNEERSSSTVPSKPESSQSTMNVVKNFYGTLNPSRFSKSFSIFSNSKVSSVKSTSSHSFVVQPQQIISDSSSAQVAQSLRNFDQQSFENQSKTTASSSYQEDKVAYSSSKNSSKINTTPLDQTALLDDDVEITCMPSSEIAINKVEKPAIANERSAFDHDGVTMEITCCITDKVACKEPNEVLNACDDFVENSHSSFNIELVKKIDTFSPSSNKEQSCTSDVNIETGIRTKLSKEPSNQCKSWTYTASPLKKALSGTDNHLSASTPFSQSETFHHSQLHPHVEDSASQLVPVSSTNKVVPVCDEPAQLSQLNYIQNASSFGTASMESFDKRHAQCNDRSVPDDFATDSANVQHIVKTLAKMKTPEPTLPLAKTTNVLTSWSNMPSNANETFEVLATTVSSDDEVSASIKHPLPQLTTGNNTVLQSFTHPLPLNINDASTSISKKTLTSPPLKRSSENRDPESATVSSTEPQASDLAMVDDCAVTSIKRIRLISEPSATNLTNSMFDQNTTENITMDEFLSMYVNVRIGVSKKGSRGKRSLVFPMVPAKKPSDIGGLVRAIYEQEYQLPILQEFQQSIRDQLSRDDNKLVELEKKFNSANPELIQKIRFGKKEESEKLVAEVDEIGKQCKKVAKIQWKKAKNKLRKSFLKSWECLKENEVDPILQEIEKYDDIKELIKNVTEEIERARKVNEEKLADLKSVGALATDKQQQQYQKNKQKIQSLEQELMKQRKEREEYRRATAKFNESMSRVWRYVDEENRRNQEIEEKRAQERATSKERKALQRYLLWEIVENRSSFKSFSFMDGSLLFSVSYSEDGDISTFNLESELEGYDELYSLLHRYILSDDDIRFLLKRNDLSVDVTKLVYKKVSAFIATYASTTSILLFICKSSLMAVVYALIIKALSILSRKVAAAISLQNDIRRLSRNIGHCSIDVEETSIRVKFYSRSPILCRFPVRFHMFDNKKDCVCTYPVSFEYIEDPTSFGPFRETEIRQALHQVESKKTSFKDCCNALLHMMNTPRV